VHYREIDLREGLMRKLYLSLSHGFSIINNNLENIEWYDGLFAKEQAEMIFGIAFVAAQKYITGSISDIFSAAGKGNNLTKLNMISKCSPEVAGDTTKISLIYAIANYFKHHDEWDNWEANGHKKSTIETLGKCNINEETEFPCQEVVTILWGEKKFIELNNLLDILVEWRKKLLLEFIEKNNKVLES